MFALLKVQSNSHASMQGFITRLQIQADFTENDSYGFFIYFNTQDVIFLLKPTPEKPALIQNKYLLIFLLSATLKQTNTAVSEHFI